MKLAKEVHTRLLKYWNRQDAKGMASLFADDANVVGFDGSEMKGKLAIEIELGKVFSNHKTATYIWIVTDIRLLSPDVCLLMAHVGMIPPGKKEINPETNAIQAMALKKDNEGWKISLFQNTPAQFHGRPELVKKMTEELNTLLS